MDMEKNSGNDLRAEELEFLKKRVSLLDDVLDSSAVGIFILDAAFKIVRVNRAIEQFFGVQRDEIIGLDKRETILGRFKDIFEDPEDFVRKVLATYQDNTYIESFECHVLSGEGREDRWLQHWSQPIASGLYAGGRIEHYTDITGRKQATAALEQAHRKQAEALAYAQTLHQTFPAPVFTKDCDGRYLDCNRAFTELTGVTAEALRGKTVQEIWPDEYAAVYHRKDLELIRTGGYQEYEFRIPDREGRDREVLFFKSVFRDTSGQVAGIIGAYLDISEQKLFEATLRQSEERYRGVVEDTPVLICCFLPDGTITFVNRTYCEYFAKTSEELVGSNFLSLLPEIDRRLLMTKLSAMTVDSPTRSTEHQVILPNGDIRWQRWTDRAIFDDRGKLVSYQSIGEDITERKEHEQERKRFMHLQRERIKELHCLNTVTENIRRLERLEEVLQATVRLIPQGWQYPEITCARIVFNGEAFVSEPFAESRWCLSREFLVRDKRGRVEVFYLEKRPAEDEGPFLKEERNLLHNIAHLLEEAAGKEYVRNEKTRLEEQYQQAQKLESIGRLAGGVAHDLNNLLTPILGYGDLFLNDEVGDDERRPIVKEIVNAGTRARNLVRQLLAFSRKQTLDFRPVALNNLLKKFEKLLRRTIREDVIIKLIPAKDLPPIQGDVGQLEQVVMNLAVNAQDAMPDGGQLTIKTARVDPDEDYAEKHGGISPGPYVLLDIRDTGCGITEETREHLFEPFFTTKSKDKGTGLGLATVYGVVKQHGGNIRVNSQPARGTSFRIYLPACEEKRIKEQIREGSATYIPGGETILVVEDNAQVRDLSRVILERQGYTVLVAQGGQEALEILEHHDKPVHLLLTDVVMPRMNGKELFQRVTASHPDIKVIYMSGYTDDVIAHHGVTEPGFHFIQKPFTVRGLAAKVREVLDL